MLYPPIINLYITLTLALITAHTFATIDPKHPLNTAMVTCNMCWVKIIKLFRYLISGALKMQDQKMQDLQMEDQMAGVENSGPENAGPNVRRVDPTQKNSTRTHPLTDLCWSDLVDLNIKGAKGFVLCSPKVKKDTKQANVLRRKIF